MKRLLIVFLLLAGALAGHAQVDVTISDQQFYDELDPYGVWINYPQYGYVWEPGLDRRDAFTPYSTNGRWVYTEEGWTWVSGYPWGWATFHYGRWFYDDYMGWLWIPGYEWAPAWVTWGSYEGYYGWAPLGPGISISVGLGWRPPRSIWWTFVPCNHFGEERWHNYAVRNNTTIINHVTIINNVYQGGGRPGGRPGQWMRGPRREEVEHLSNRPVRPMTFNNVQRPGAARIQNNSIALYRPVVNRNPQGTQGRPNHVQPIDRVRPETKLPGNNPGSRPVNPGAPGNPGVPGHHPGRPENPPARPVNPPPANLPGNRPVNPPPAENHRPVNPPHDRPDRPLNPNPGSRPPGNPSNPGQRPVNPRPDNPPPQRPGNPPPQRPNNPPPERPMNRPENRPPVMPGNRPANPNPGMPPPNRPAGPPAHRVPPQEQPPQQPPGRRKDG